MTAGMVILGIGIGMFALAAVLFLASFVYRRTAGRKIRDELGTEYGLDQHRGSA